MTKKIISIGLLSLFLLVKTNYLYADGEELESFENPTIDMRINKSTANLYQTLLRQHIQPADAKNVEIFFSDNLKKIINDGMSETYDLFQLATPTGLEDRTKPLLVEEEYNVFFTDFANAFNTLIKNLEVKETTKINKILSSIKRFLQTKSREKNKEAAFITNDDKKAKAFIANGCSAFFTILEPVIDDELNKLKSNDTYVVEREPRDIFTKFQSDRTKVKWYDSKKEAAGGDSNVVSGYKETYSIDDYPQRVIDATDKNFDENYTKYHTEITPEEESNTHRDVNETLGAVVGKELRKRYVQNKIVKISLNEKREQIQKKLLALEKKHKDDPNYMETAVLPQKLLKEFREIQDQENTQSDDNQCAVS